MAELNPIIIDEIFVARYAALKPELDRLEAENQRLSEAVAGYHRAAEADRAEIVRLREALVNTVGAIETILPLAKGYNPKGQTKQAFETCNRWIRAAIVAMDNGSEALD